MSLIQIDSKVAKYWLNYYFCDHYLRKISGMNISYNWLKSYINIDNNPREVASMLTSIGLEVGSIEEFETIKGGLKGLVIGEVLTCEKHPNADKLSITTVNIGDIEPLHIVCGAPNVAAGQKVVVATIGTGLHMGKETFIIKKSKIRGELSEGMICAEDEIGLGNSHAGIIVLPSDSIVGTPARDYFGISEDTILEVDITPNRIDAASHYGVARDLAAFLKASGKEVILSKPDVNKFTVDDNTFVIDVTVTNFEACPRYCGVTLNNVKVGPSPEWLQNKLKAIGMTPINNIVDVTNFVLHEQGQPLHAFDGEKIEGNKIIVRTESEGKLFTTLDEAERKLSENDLMICNEKEGMCIAGVFGGIKSGVSESTTKIFLESAYFNPVWVRKTAKRHTLSTDSSFRFERGVDPENVLYSLKRAALLIKEVAGGTISSNIVDIYPENVERKNFDIDLNYVRKTIGKEIDNETILTILESLEIIVKPLSVDVVNLEIPAYRVDVTRPIDVVEDILRIYGYNNVEPQQKLNSTLSYKGLSDKDHKLKNLIAEFLVGEGFHEIICNSLTSSGYYKELVSYPENNLVYIVNPLSNDLNCMRQTLLFGGLQSITYNLNRKQGNLKLFEFGNCYIQDRENKSSELLETITEKQYLSILLSGNRLSQNWLNKEEEISVFDTKAYVVNILNRLGFESNRLQVEEFENDIFDYGLKYSINGSVVVELGKISTKILKKTETDAPVFYTNIN